ncbi:MAG: AbrB/MazE/SpoVT family DNA-binding domain-containing protein [Methanobacteriota archaeon]
MEFVKMSKKGQVVIPAELRALLGLNAEDRFIAYGEKDYVIFKRVDFPSVEKEFDKLVKATSKLAKEAGITEEVVMEEIREYRKKRQAA